MLVRRSSSAPGSRSRTRSYVGCSVAMRPGMLANARGRTADARPPTPGHAGTRALGQRRAGARAGRGGRRRRGVAAARRARCRVAPGDAVVPVASAPPATRAGAPRPRRARAPGPRGRPADASPRGVRARQGGSGRPAQGRPPRSRDAAAERSTAAGGHAAAGGDAATGGDAAAGGDAAGRDAASGCDAAGARGQVRRRRASARGEPRADPARPVRPRRAPAAEREFGFER